MAQAEVRTHGTVAEQWLSLAKPTGIVIGASAVIAVCARLVLPLPFTPVPLTLANFGVLLVGQALGSKRGFAAAALYLVWGAMGLPVFSPAGVGGIAQLFGPTGGYLLAYPAAAWVAGTLNRRASSLITRWLAAIAGVAVIFFGGLAQLTLLTGSVARAVQLGITPFAALDLVKAFIAAVISGSRVVRRGA